MNPERKRISEIKKTFSAFECSSLGCRAPTAPPGRPPVSRICSPPRYHPPRDSVKLTVCTERQKLILRDKIEGGEADRSKIGIRLSHCKLDRSRATTQAGDDSLRMHCRRDLLQLSISEHDPERPSVGLAPRINERPSGVPQSLGLTPRRRISTRSGRGRVTEPGLSRFRTSRDTFPYGILAGASGPSRAGSTCRISNLFRKDDADEYE
jgi:hypothetical protein